MADRLPVIRLQPQTVVDWSGFLGASEDVLRQAYPKARRIVVEHDELLAAHGAAKAPWWSLRRRPASEVLPASSVPAGAGQLLWANMRLQAEGDPPALMAQWHRALAVDGFLMFSTLGPGTLPELRELHGERGWGPPMADFVDMHDLGDMLVHAGFADPVMDQETITLTWATPQAALAELRALGGNAHPRRPPGLRPRAWLDALHQALLAWADAQGRVALRFEVVYGHAFRPAAKALVQPHTEVSLDAMREMVRAGRPRPR
jgi:malonyl-CoA O-methyltransferase